jgi:iron complex transport system permease protein
VARDGTRRRATIGASLGVALAAALLGGLLAGEVDIDFADLVLVLAVKLGFSDDAERLTDSVLWAIRFPRVLSGALVGAVLGWAGAGLQGAFCNQMHRHILSGFRVL